MGRYIGGGREMKDLRRDFGGAATAPGCLLIPISRRQSRIQCGSIKCLLETEAELIGGG